MELSGFFQAISPLAAGALIASAWQGPLLAAIVWVCLKLAPRTTANLRFLVWMAVFLTVLLLPFLSFVSASHAGPASASAAGRGFSPVHLDARWASALCLLWLAASLVRAGLLARSALYLRSIGRRSSPISADVGDSGRRLFRNPALCSSADVDQPCVIGFFRPKILIPGWLLREATRAELEQIVLHESAHLRRFDDGINLLQKLVLVCFPLSPGLLWADRRLCAEREEACDESVVRATRSPYEYATCLASLAEKRFTGRTAALSLSAWQSQSELGRRIESILHGGKRMGALQARWLTAALLLGTLSGALKLGESAQLVTFTAAPGSRLPLQADDGPAASQALYHEAVYHQSAVATNAVYKPETHANSAKPAMKSGFARRGSLHRGSATHTRPAIRLAGAREDRTAGWVIVTRFSTFSGPQSSFTVVDRIVRLSVPSAAPSQSGWYVFSL